MNHRLRAEVRKDRSTATKVWTVTLWSHDQQNVPFYFGQRSFITWPDALGWALRRVR